MKLVVLRKNAISEKLKRKIILLKRSEWKFTLKSHTEWFEKQIKNIDSHILLFNKKELIGYNLLRKRNFYLNLKKKIKKNYLYFDTLIIKKKFRKKNLSKIIIDISLEISQKKKLPLILICQKKNIIFYKRNRFILLKKKLINFQDHEFTSHAMIYMKKINNLLITNKLNINLN